MTGEDAKAAELASEPVLVDVEGRGQGPLGRHAAHVRRRLQKRPLQLNDSAFSFRLTLHRSITDSV